MRTEGGINNVAMVQTKQIRTLRREAAGSDLLFLSEPLTGR